MRLVSTGSGRQYTRITGTCINIVGAHLRQHTHTHAFHSFTLTVLSVLAMMTTRVKIQIRLGMSQHVWKLFFFYWIFSLFGSFFFLSSRSRRTAIRSFNRYKFTWRMEEEQPWGVNFFWRGTQFWSSDLDISHIVPGILLLLLLF